MFTYTRVRSPRRQKHSGGGFTRLRARVTTYYYYTTAATITTAAAATATTTHNYYYYYYYYYRSPSSPLPAPHLRLASSLLDSAAAETTVVRTRYHTGCGGERGDSIGLLFSFRFRSFRFFNFFYFIFTFLHYFCCPTTSSSSPSLIFSICCSPYAPHHVCSLFARPSS